MYDEKNDKIEFIRFQPSSNDNLQKCVRSFGNVNLHSLSKDISESCILHVHKHSSKINIPAVKAPKKWGKPDDYKELTRRTQMILKMLRE